MVKALSALTTFTFVNISLIVAYFYSGFFTACLTLLFTPCFRHDNVFIQKLLVILAGVLLRCGCIVQCKL